MHVIICSPEERFESIVIPKSLCFFSDAIKLLSMFEVSQKQELKLRGKQELKNYRRISLLPGSGKIFERFLYDSMFTFFIENNLISQNHSGLTPGDSCTNQLLSITYQIYKSFDDVHEVLSLILDI